MTLRNPGEIFFYMLAEREPRRRRPTAGSKVWAYLFLLRLVTPVNLSYTRPSWLAAHGPLQVKLNPGKLCITAR